MLVKWCWLVEVYLCGGGDFMVEVGESGVFLFVGCFGFFGNVILVQGLGLLFCFFFDYVLYYGV